MKNQLFIILILITFFSCRREIPIEEQMQPKTTICYKAIDGTDTIWLSIDTLRVPQLIGTFEMNYAKQKRRMYGQFKGLLKGDTIKGHYDFKVNKVDKWYRNPVAFLKRNNKLNMGVGEMVMQWGSPFFDEKTPIDYEKGRFVFTEIACK